MIATVAPPATLTGDASIHPSLRSFACYLLANQLEPFVETVYHALNKRNLWPLPGLEHMDRDAWMANGTAQMTVHLGDIANSTLEALLAKNIGRYENYYRDAETGNVLFPEEFVKINAARKECFLQFIPAYTSTVTDVLELVAAIDEFTEKFDSAFNKVYRTHIYNQQAHEQKLYRQAQAIAKIGNFTFEVSSGKVTWSEEVYRIYGVPHDPSHTTVEALRSYTLPRYRPIVDAHITRCVANGGSYMFQYEIQLPDGMLKTLRARGEAEYDEHGKTARIIGTVQDVSDQVLIEKRLREHQLFTDKITNATPAVITVLNVQTGTYRFVSNMAKSIFGYTVDDMMAGGMGFVVSLVHPDDIDVVIQENEAAIARANAAAATSFEDNHIVTFRYRIRKKNGEYICLTTYAIIFDRDTAGKVESVLNVSIDTTAMAGALEQLRIKNEALQQSNASLEEFAYIASHDLQEPLRKIGTFGNMLETRAGSGLGEQCTLYVRKMMESAGRMQNMINDLLSVSLIAADKKFVKESLQLILTDVLQSMADKTEAINARVIIEQPLPEAQVVASQMRQLFQNLISNSVKFAKADTPLELRIGSEAATAEEVADKGLDGDKKYAVISFQDNGIGFDNQYAHRIFAIFQRLNGKSEYEGTGIGLAICRKIVLHHGGAISATSSRNKGARFEILLPVS